MGIGSGIFLFVIGAILAFAIHVQLAWVSLTLVGYLLMGAGIVVFVISLLLVLRRRSSVVTTRSAVDPNSGERVEQHETKSDTL
jgi:membrane protein implicated in regulation of membrane protease activity